MPALPPLTRNLILIGGRGSGKSSLSRRLVRRDKRLTPLCTDDLIRYERGGASIPSIVEREGWSGFRELEYDVVRKVAAFAGSALIDCGGGVIVDLDADGYERFSERKVNALRETGLIVYLQRDVDYLIGRIEGDPNRPPLSDEHGFREIMERRDPWYRRAAHWVLRCGTRGKGDLADDILGWYYGQLEPP